MTLRRFLLLRERKAAIERRMDLRFGVIATVIARANGAKNVGPEDFFPAPKARAKRMDPMVAQAKLDQLRGWLKRRGLGG